VVQTILGHSDVKTTLSFYYDQDLERVTQVLETTEMGKLLPRRAAAATQKRSAKIVEVDFGKLVS